MKYVMFEVEMGNLTRRIPFIFPNSLIHKDIAEFGIRVLTKPEYKFDEVIVISAGNYDMISRIASGSSETLHMQALPEDSKTITEYDYSHGIVY
jgi:hypothetical protein